jgi:hypothetical protein
LRHYGKTRTGMPARSFALWWGWWGNGKVVGMENSIRIRGKRSSPIFILLITSLAALPLQPVSAQLTVTYTDLHPVMASKSSAWAANGSFQGGFAYLEGYYHAALWCGSGSSFVDLNPAGSQSSFVQAVSGSRQGGSAGINHHAALWSGSAASFVDLHPAGASYSSIYGMSGLEQVGFAAFGNQHAALWRGTAGSFVDLHPAGATSSAATDTTGAQQVGYAKFSSDYHAALWSGTVSSFLDLNPAGASSSEAYGLSGSQQVGRANFNGSDHAGFWSGSAASFVDLHPLGAAHSGASATIGSFQVGYASFGGVDHAVLWSGTAGSVVDLQAILGEAFPNGSIALDVTSNGDFIYVAGEAIDSSGNPHAIVWTIVPEPSTGVLLGMCIVCLYLHRSASSVLAYGKTCTEMPARNFAPVAGGRRRSIERL